MKKVFSILLKIVLGICIAFVTLIIALMLIVHSAYTVKPSVRQLEKAVGVNFPAFTILQNRYYGPPHPCGHFFVFSG